MKKTSHIEIQRKDVYWNYFATLLQIGSGVLLFPFILRVLPSPTIGIWSVFLSVSSLANLLDFGFSNSFSRNISYIFSGLGELKKTGISTQFAGQEPNYKLLSGSIRAMKWFYSRIGLISIFLLLTLGSVYIHHICQTQKIENTNESLIAWVLFSITISYNIYTLYYDALLQGRGMIKKDKQIIIISQIAYLLSTIIFLTLHKGLISLVLSQAISIIIRRMLYKNCFFDEYLKSKLSDIPSTEYKNILQTIVPNASKVGVTSVGAFLVLQSSVLLGSLFVDINQLASYNITVQVINVIASLSTVYYATQIPRLAALRVKQDNDSIIKTYYKSLLILISTFLVLGSLLIFTGNPTLQVLHSNTYLLSSPMLLTILIITLLEKNHAIAGGFLLSKNEVPFYKAAICSGIATLILLFITMKYFEWGIWGMILAPGIVQISYQNWKWPITLIKDLKHKQ